MLYGECWMHVKIGESHDRNAEPLEAASESLLVRKLFGVLTLGARANSSFETSASPSRPGKFLYCRSRETGPDSCHRSFYVWNLCLYWEQGGTGSTSDLLASGVATSSGQVEGVSGCESFGMRNQHIKGHGCEHLLH